MKAILVSLSLIAATVGTSEAQTADNPEIAACKATGLLALKQTTPSVHDVVLDMDTMIVSKANTEIEGIPIRTVVMGDAYLEKRARNRPSIFSV